MGCHDELSEMIRHANFPSRHVPPRHVDVWLPPGYEINAGRRYSVLYMHDGQNCFSPEDSAYGVAWEAQNALARLIAAGEAEPAIIAGIWNIAERRHLEYCPRRPFPVISAEGVEILPGLTGVPQSDAYLAFVVMELKPFIDAQYRTMPDREHTFLMGSSMGGLISLYALCEYPDVFGAAACVSTHWPAVEGVIVPYLRAHLPDPASHRIYFDHGTAELDAAYGALQQLVDEVMVACGYVKGFNWETREFPGAGHFEADWQARVHIPLRFLLSEEKSRERSEA
jgi:predicted alpha/beta superfamily hydrolase